MTANSFPWNSKPRPFLIESSAFSSTQYLPEEGRQDLPNKYGYKLPLPQWEEEICRRGISKEDHCWEMEKVMLLVTVGLLVALGASIAAGEKANCTYAIEIETTCTHGAGTTDPVSLRFGDSNGTDVLVRHLNPSLVKRVDRAAIQVLDDRPRQPFHECGLDVFQTVGPCVLSPVCYLYVKQLGADPWRPGYAHVRVLDNPSLSSSRLFYRTYLPRNVWNGQDVCDKVVTSFGIKHVRKVFSKSGRIHT